MWFRRLTFKNAGRFADFDVELKRGSIGVFGANGTGKSTLLGFMRAIPTNNFNWFDGVKIDCIRNTSEDKDESYIYGKIEHDGHVMDIRRYLRPKGKVTTELVVDGGTAITDANKAQEEIDKILGVDKVMIDLYCFKAQDQIYDFLTMTPGDRAKAFAVLCRTEKCEELWSMLGEYLNKSSEVNQVFADNSDELALAISTHKARIEELANAVALESEMLLNGKSEQSAKDILRKQDRLEDLLGQKEKVDAKVKDLDEQVEKAVNNVRICKRKLDALKEAVAAKRGDYDAAKIALRNMEQYKKQRARRRQLKDEADSLIREEARTPPPSAPKIFGVKDLAKLKKEYAQKELELAAAQSVVAAFNTSKGIVACPTCGTPGPAIQDYIDVKRKIVQDYPQLLSYLLHNEIEILDDYSNSVRTYEKWHSGFEARKAANQAAREALEEIKAPEGDEESLNKVVQAFVVLEEELDECQERYRGRVIQQDSAKIDLKIHVRRQLEIVQGIAENTESEDKVAKARKRLEEHALANRNIADLTGEKRGVQRQLDEKEEELKKLRARLKRSKNVRKMAAVISRVRDVLHRDALPRRVAQANLSSMEGDINEGLGHFGDPYWVESDANLNFIVHKPGEPPQPAGRLSTGQRVILALSFWPAVASLWQSDLGMLALDEPTANLDEENRKFLAQALGTLTARVRGRRQLIMVTHDSNLESSFDQTIKLGV